MGEGRRRGRSDVVSGRHALVVARVEVRRIAGPVRRTAVVAVVGVPLVLALTGEGLAVAVLVVLGIGVWMQGPLELLRDRLGGDLLFLSTLPVSAATVAAGKLLAAGVPCLLSAALLGAAGAIAGPEVASSLGPLEAGVGIFAGSALLTTTLAFLACALVARVRIRILTSSLAPLAALGVGTFLLWLVDRLVSDPWARVEWLLSRPWLPPVAALLSLLAAAVLWWIALRITARGIRRYRPDSDALSW